MYRAPSEFRCGSKPGALVGSKAKSKCCVQLFHTTNSLIRRIKGGFSKRISKKTCGVLGPADSLSSVNLCSCESESSCRRNLLPYTINLHWLTLFIY